MLQKAIKISNMVDKPNFAGGVQSGLLSSLFCSQASFGLTSINDTETC